MTTHELKMKAFLDSLYYVFNRRELIHPDPLEFLYQYDRESDREVVGLIGASLAYGRVDQILRSVKRVLSALGDHPAQFLLDNNASPASLRDFKHRFTTVGDLDVLLANTAHILREYGSLKALMFHCRRNSVDYLSALDLFADTLYSRPVTTDMSNAVESQVKLRSNFPLVTRPSDGSACKRLMLFLRWMVRHDDVDPGNWAVIADNASVSPAELIIPTDTHIHAIARKLGLTRRKSADMTTAIEITNALAKLCPEDPTRYDFTLSRFGIRDGMSVKFFEEFT